MNHLDGLRGLAALMVVLHHSVIAFDFAFYSGLSGESRIQGDLAVSGLPLTPGALGDLAVCVFFVLSGYVLARSFAYTPLGIAALLVKRYVRLGLPILTVVVVAASLMSAGAMANSAVAALTRSAWLARQNLEPASAWQVLSDGIYGALIFGKSRYVSSLWTMPLEFQGSVVLLLAFAISRRVWGGSPRSLRYCGWGLLGFAVLMHGSLLFLFGVGAAAWIFELRRHAEPFCRAPWVVTTLVLCGLTLGTLPFSAARPEFVSQMVALAPLHPAIPWRRMEPESFWHAIGAILLLLAVDSNPALRAWFSRRPLQFLGQISFPLYLIHVPILLSVGATTYLALVQAHAPVWIATLISLVATWVAALVASVILVSTVERAAITASAAAAHRLQTTLQLASEYFGLRAGGSCTQHDNTIAVEHVDAAKADQTGH